MANETVFDQLFTGYQPEVPCLVVVDALISTNQFQTLKELIAFDDETELDFESEEVRMIVHIFNTIHPDIDCEAMRYFEAKLIRFSAAPDNVIEASLRHSDYFSMCIRFGAADKERISATQIMIDQFHNASFSARSISGAVDKYCQLASHFKIPTASVTIKASAEGICAQFEDERRLMFAAVRSIVDSLRIERMRGASANAA